jgi:putative liporotein
MTKRLKKIILCSLIIFLLGSVYYKIHKIKIERKGEDEFSKIISEIKSNFKVIIDKNKYIIKVTDTPSGWIIAPTFYKIVEKTPTKNKSKYFTNNNMVDNIRESEVVITNSGKYSFYFLDDISENVSDHIPFFSEKNSVVFLEIIGKFNFRNYILNEMLYDKSKGNDFNEIEKILDRYKNKKIKWYIGAKWSCNSKNYLFNSILSVIDNKCVIHDYKEGTEWYSYDKIEKYGTKLKKYFSKVRKLEEINWYEFMKYNNISPVISLYIDDISNEEAEKISYEIKLYYNSDDLIIRINNR